MKSCLPAVLLSLLLSWAAPARGDAPEDRTAPAPVLSVNSLVPTPEEREARTAWWREARFGMFIHWGVSSHLGGYWKGEPLQGYAEHIQRARRISMADYRREVVEKFNPTRYDADAWVRLAKETGMGYLIITAKHHDGFAMYDSKVSAYSIVKATPFGRDPMPDLAAACRRHGLKFGFYYSHAFDWGEENGPGNDWEWENPGGDRLLHGSDWWLSHPDFAARARTYVDEKAIPQIMELIHGYAPDILWFDTPHKLPPEENYRIFAAVRRAAPHITINGRIFSDRDTDYVALTDYINTGDKPGIFAPQLREWEGLPTTNNSYGYNAADRTHKPAGHFIRLLAMAAARGGNILLNAGPTSDGIIDPLDVEIFRGIGRWWSVNGESIRGTSASVLPRQPWTGECTRKGSTLYLHVFEWPRDGVLRVCGLVTPVTRAHLLAPAGSSFAAPRVTRLNPLDLVISGLPTEAPDPAVSVLALECETVPVADEAQWLDEKAPAILVHGFDARRQGSLQFRAGRGADDAWVVNWLKPGDGLFWTVRLDRPATFDLALLYDAPEGTNRSRQVEGDAGKELQRAASGAAGSYVVNVDAQVIARTVRPGLDVLEPLGRVTLAAGRHEIRVTAREVTGEELFRLRRILLQRVGG